MIRLATAFALVAALAAPAMAQNTGTTNMDILRQKVKADKKLVVAANLNLTEAEGAKFWPVYRGVPGRSPADQPAAGRGDHRHTPPPTTRGR